MIKDRKAPRLILSALLLVYIATTLQPIVAGASPALCKHVVSGLAPKPTEVDKAVNDIKKMISNS